MFLGFVSTSALLSTFPSIPEVWCGEVGESNILSDFTNGSKVTYQEVIFAPFATPVPKLQLLRHHNPHSASLEKEISKLLTKIENGRKEKKASSSIKDRSGTPRMPDVSKNSNDYGAASHYRMKRGRKDNSRKSFYANLVQNLLRPRSRSRKRAARGDYDRGSYRDRERDIDRYREHRERYTDPPEMKMSVSALSAPSHGWGKGWGGGGGHGGGGGGHGGGYSLLDLLLLKLSLLSLGGFLLNLLLNLANLFGFGLMTSTATYPVTVTSTSTSTGGGGGTSTSTGGGGTSTGGGGTSTGGTSITYSTGPLLLSNPGVIAGVGTGRTVDSMVGNLQGNVNGWGWPGGRAETTKGEDEWTGNRVRLKAHIRLPKKGWSSTTTTTTIEPLTPTLTGPVDYLDPLSPVTGQNFAGAREKVRRKREAFQPYVDPVTSLEVFAKAMLNSVHSARHNYACMEQIHCENNKQARVVGQWLDYFMPVYSFSLSLIGHRTGTHQSLFKHFRAIVLGAAEANCRAHFPRCEPSDSRTVK